MIEDEPPSLLKHFTGTFGIFSTNNMPFEPKTCNKRVQLWYTHLQIQRVISYKHWFANLVFLQDN